MDIPHEIKPLPLHYFDETDIQGDYTYIKDFHVELTKRRFFLRFEGVMLQMDVYLNGREVGHFVSGYAPVEIDVTNFLVNGKNFLVIHVNTKEDPLVPPFGGVVDYQTFGGIYRPIYLIDKPLKNAIDDVYARGRANGEIDVFAEVEAGAEITNFVYDGDQLVGKFQGSRGKIENYELYSPSHPKLYNLITRTSTDEVTSSLAFFDADWREDGFYLNDEKLFLFGLNRHQTYPYIGGAAAESLQKEDARKLKKLGINVVRTSHYPQSEAFLSECERLGIFIIDEIPGWQHVSKDPLWRERCLALTEAMVIKDRRHPGVIAYGVRIDESQDDSELYGETNHLAKLLDPERATIGVRNFKDSECLEDVYGYNDFSCIYPRHGVDKVSSWSGAKGKAKLITEHSGHTYPTKSFDPPSVRVTQALRHALIVDQARGDKDCAGVIGWCAFDYATHRQFGSGDKICYHGVCDIFRNPKWAGYFYASQGEEPFLGVASSFLASEYEGGVLPTIPVFTNADYIEVYLDDVLVHRLYPDKETYPNLLHPPVFIKNLVGDNFSEPILSESESRFMVQFLQGHPERGVEGMSLGTKIKMLALLKRHHLPPQYVYDLYYKYVGFWGCKEERVVTIRAFLSGKCFCEKKFGNSQKTRLALEIERDYLVNGDEYDVIPILVKRVDQYGNLCSYANDIISVNVSFPFCILSPQSFSLNGGVGVIYLRSVKTKKRNVGKIVISGPDGTFSFPISVQNATSLPQ
ncbi:MAG: glycoside hydrolase family 2 TIM barrel-domain containing protein [Candidatus Enteromonas sp.]|nr:glycoside hydrolase family 2 TIM barrel-domain containing protein [Candidatus Enteromonas sp.]